MVKKLSDSSLLIVTDRYPHIKDPISYSFVKSQIECIKGSFREVHIMVLSPMVPKFLSHFSFMDNKGRWDGFARDYTYDNVQVHFAKPIALPFEYSWRKRGENSAKRSSRLIRDNGIEFDLIHAHFSYPAGYAGARLKDIYHKPMALTIHEDRDFFLSEIASKDENLLYAWRAADKIIRVNRRDLTELEKLGIERSKLICIPNGYSPGIFHPMDKMAVRRKLGLPTSDKILVNLAALQPYKGQKFLVEAMEKVISRREDVILYIVGKGPLKKSLQSAIEKKELRDKVVLAGGDKPLEDIPLWINAGDIFVLPSLSEGNPTVMFEALGCGKPFIGTDVGGIPEVISDDRLGILVKPKDSQGLADAIIRGLSVPWNEEYILNYAQKFTWGEAANRILKAYGELIEKSGSKK